MTQQEREAYARIGARAAELMVRYPERSVDYCLYIAALEDVLLYGSPYPDLPTVRVLGRSAIQTPHTGIRES